ncbi:MAG TPA: NAD(P)/FAD-dependent oxidoreductase [Solirubrobacterales bacterium]|jgi:protoporphyrinogen oxidase|nr:NAD(P)/FAD-dependent oxidoreductase [Solirubrobacterales bacterium]
MTAPASRPESAPVAVLGAGPAGLTAAYRLVQRGVPVVVFEVDDEVGGLARTVVRDGYRFDLGGHRFFTKSEEVQELWEELLGPELLVRPRLSRIYWRGRFIEYPLRPADVFAKVGPLELARSLASYARARLGRRDEAETYEEWVSDRFGRRLFELFFKTYTEKVWGVGTDELRAEWAAQRIADLSLASALRAALPGGGETPKSLIEQFRYPRLGPGQMWEEMARRIEAGGGEIRLGDTVEGLEHEGGRLTAVRAGGERVEVSAAISSIPLRTTVGAAEPAPPREVTVAAAGLRYRDFLTVALPIDGEPPFPDNWVYVHDPRARVGRIQNFRAWSPWMTPDPRRSCLGLEYFCFEGDELWCASDEELVELGRREVAALGLVDPERVAGGHVVRVPKAYPVYDAEYAGRVERIRSWLDGISNLQQVGRNGLHRYNNSDHSMLTAMRAVENLCDGAGHDVWAVNAESVYHERHEVEEQPYRVAPETPAMARPLAELGD